jgi:hypothetical protein
MKLAMSMKVGHVDWKWRNLTWKFDMGEMDDNKK